MLSLLTHIFSLILFVLLSIPVVYFFIMAIAARLRSKHSFAVSKDFIRIAILIPAYKEDAVILETCRSISMHDYPADRYSVFVAAHKLFPQTVERLKEMPLQVVEIDGDYGSKALSLQRLLDRINVVDFDLGLILDADNILEAGALIKINDAYHSGERAMQLHRVAKNTESSFSYLEGISEEINNNLFRQGPRAFNLSASTIGSGMAFPVELLKKIYNLDGIIYNPACDRVVDFETMKAGINIEYLDDVYVKDEKVSDTMVFRRQRTRWIESQLIHLRLFYTQYKALDFLSLNVWHKLLANILPPRIVILGLLTLINIVLLLPFPGIISPAPVYWRLLLSVYIITLAISIPLKFYNARFLKAIALSPVAFLNMLIALFHANPKRKEFLHTPKTYNENQNDSKG